MISNQMVVTSDRRFSPHRVLKFRLGGYRKGQFIMNATVKAFIYDHQTLGSGQTLHNQRTLKLENDFFPVLNLHGECVHVIDEASPLFPGDSQALATFRSKWERIRFTVSGTENTFKTDFRGYFGLKCEQIIEGEDLHFADLFVQEDGRTIIDIDRFHVVEREGPEDDEGEVHVQVQARDRAAV